MTATPAHRPPTPLLDTVKAPEAIRRLQKAQLPKLSDELRAEMTSAVSVTRGRLGAGLGVVELTVAMHHVFDIPDDKLTVLKALRRNDMQVEVERA